MGRAKQHPGDRLTPSGEQGMLGALCRNRAGEHIMDTMGRRSLPPPRLGNEAADREDGLKYRIRSRPPNLPTSH